MRRVLLALVILAVAEIYLLARLGEAFGALAVMGLLVGSAALGYLAARAQGLAVVRRWRDAAETGEAPEEGLTDGLLVVLGGLLLALPGVLSDLLGLFLLIPPVRRRAAAHLRRKADTWLSSGSVKVTRMRVVDVRTDAVDEGDPKAFDPRAEPHREVIDAEGVAVEERPELLLGPAKEDEAETSRE